MRGPVQYLSLFLLRLNSTSSCCRDEESDMQSAEIIEKSLELLNSMLSLVRESTRAGGHVLQNFTTMAAWVRRNEN